MPELLLSAGPVELVEPVEPVEPLEPASLVSLLVPSTEAVVLVSPPAPDVIASLAEAVVAGMVELVVEPPSSEPLPPPEPLEELPLPPHPIANKERPKIQDARCCMGAG